jgi:hypothetical protein
MMIWAMLHPNMTMEMLGFLPMFMSEDDPRPAREQIDAAYQHGGGWNPFKGFELLENGDLKYPGDPPTKRLAVTVLHQEEVSFYEHAWVVIKQPDGSWEVARID